MSRLAVKVFCATKARERVALGQTVTTWLRDRIDVRVIDHAVLQSSDAQFHCLTIVLFYEA